MDGRIKLIICEKQNKAILASLFGWHWKMSVWAMYMYMIK